MVLKMKLSSLLILLMVLLSALSFGQSGTGEQVLGVDDVISISVLNHQGMDRDATVLADGTITYPFVGKIKASGRTPTSLADEIKRALEKTLNNVAVTVTIKEVRSQKARIVGPVKSPGAYDVKPKMRLLDLVAMAGGLADTRPTRISGRVIRPNGKVDTFEMVKASLEPDSDANPLISANDLVYLEERDPANNKIFVMGQVNKPGGYEVPEAGANLIAILSEAGNTLPNAALSRAVIMRGKEGIPLNLEPMVNRGILTDEIKNLQLQAGDVLFVPEIETRIAVMGQVNKPGQYAMPENKPLLALDALSLAGGQTQNGDLGKAGVIRTINGKATVIPINVDEILKAKKLEKNIPLQAGDVLFIPAKGQPRDFEWRNLLGPLSILSFFGIKF